MKPVVAIGEILVEIMAILPGKGFRQPIDLVGPFPSGAPAIFIDQVARLGAPCAMIGCVGDDDFGWLNIERLRGDGVDVSAIEVRNGAEPVLRAAESKLGDARRLLPPEEAEKIESVCRDMRDAFEKKDTERAQNLKYELNSITVRLAELVIKETLQNSK